MATTTSKPKKEKKYKCTACGEKEKVYRMFDVDGTNLEEAKVCLNCGDGALSTVSNNEDEDGQISA